MDRFAIVQEEYGGFDPERLAAVYEARLGMLRFDAAKKAREGRGILAEDLDAATAEAFERDLAAIGLAARRIPQPRVLRIGKPSLVRTVYVPDDAFHVVEGYEGAPRAIPWDYVWLLSAGEVVETRQVAGSSPSLSGRKRRGLQWGLSALAGPVVGTLALQSIESDVGRLDSASARRESRAALLLDVFTGTLEGDFLHLRLRARDLYYDRVLGPLATRDWFANFRLVLGHLASRARRAVVTPALEALARGEAEDPSIRFGTEAEFTQYNRWQLQLLALAVQPPV